MWNEGVLTMTVSRAEWANGRALVYNEFGVCYHQFPCKKLIGYGPKGIVTENNAGIIDVITMDCRYRHLAKFQFAKEQWTLHDDFLQVRVL